IRSISILINLLLLPEHMKQHVATHTSSKQHSHTHTHTHPHTHTHTTHTHTHTHTHHTPHNNTHTHTHTHTCTNVHTHTHVVHNNQPEPKRLVRVKLCLVCPSSKNTPKRLNYFSHGLIQG